jgi:hypothetical protein
MGRKNRRLREIIHEYYNPTTPLTVEAVPKLASAIVGLYQERQMMGELTGEWIVSRRATIRTQEIVKKMLLR